jgi:hypothetical protein
MRIPIGIADHKRGDTWDGMEVIATETDEFDVVVPIDLTGVEIVSQFKTSINEPFVFEFKSSDGTILVTDPESGTMYFNERNMDFPVKTYFFDIQLKFPNGRVQTIVPTHTWTLIQDITIITA